jgi:hypothetical protein
MKPPRGFSATPRPFADRHYVKPSEVLPGVRKAVDDAVSGLTDVQRVCSERVN